MEIERASNVHKEVVEAGYSASGFANWIVYGMRNRWGDILEHSSEKFLLIVLKEGLVFSGISGICFTISRKYVSSYEFHFCNHQMIFCVPKYYLNTCPVLQNWAPEIVAWKMRFVPQVFQPSFFLWQKHIYWTSPGTPLGVWRRIFDRVTNTYTFYWTRCLHDLRVQGGQRPTAQAVNFTRQYLNFLTFSHSAFMVTVIYVSHKV